MTSETDAILTEPRLTPKEAAGRLGRCTKTVLQAIKRGDLAPVIRNAKRGPGAIEIPESSLAAFQRRKLVAGGAS